MHSNYFRFFFIIMLYTVPCIQSLNATQKCNLIMEQRGIIILHTFSLFDNEHSILERCLLVLSGLQMQFPLSTVTVSTLGENLLRRGDDDACGCKLVVDPALESPITD